LAAQGFIRRSSTTKQGPSVVEEIDSSPEGSPIKTPETTTSPVLGSEQASTETSPPSSKQTSASRPIPKTNATSKHGPAAKKAEESKSKRVKTSVPPSPNLEKFLKRSVVRGKIVKIGYFKEQGLEVFLKKLRRRVAGDFTNTQLRCSQPDLAEFYARVIVIEVTVTSTVNRVHIEFDAQTLKDILGVPAVEFDMYVREDRSLLGKAKLLEKPRG